MLKLYSFILSLTVIGTLSAQENNSISFQSIANKGDSLTYLVKYPMNGKLSDSSVPVYGAVYSYQHYDWKVSRFRMSKTTAQHYEGIARVTTGASISYVRFYQGDFQYPDTMDDNGNKGYVLPVSKIKAGYYAGRASLHPDSTLLLLSKEWALKGTDTLQLATTYFNYLKQKDAATYRDKAKQQIKAWATSGSITDDQLMQLYFYANASLNDKPFSAWLRDINVQRFPEGALSRMEAAQKNMNAKNLDEVIHNTESFLRQFPYAQWQVHPNGQEFLYYEAYRTLAAAYFDKKELTAFYALTKDLNFKTLNEICRWNILRAYTFKTVGIDTVSRAATYLIDLLIARVNDGSMSTNGLMPLDYAIENAHKQLDQRLTTQIRIMNTIGQYDRASYYYNYISDEGRYTDPDLNEAHGLTLSHVSDDNTQQAFIEKCVHADAVTATMIDRLKELYISQHHSSTGFDDYFNSLKSALSIQKLHNEIRKSLVRMDFEPFALESSQGGLIRSSDWDGKIVVLDFWATWCKPCIESFPSMQKVVDKYQGDAGVLFYFVGTMQYGDYKQKDSAYIKSNGFRFNLAYDGMSAETGSQNAAFSKLAPMFHSSAIPRKVIIKDGIIRYTTEGFGGSTSNLMEEISYAIQLLKNEDNKN